MPARDVRILVVGPVMPHLQTLLERLACHGWHSYSVETCAEAHTVFRTLQFEVVLAKEEMADGHGFQLWQVVARRSASLYVEVDLSEGHLWLPTVERGKRTLGERALDPDEFETQVMTVLSSDGSRPLPGQAPLIPVWKLPRMPAIPIDSARTSGSTFTTTTASRVPANRGAPAPSIPSVTDPPVRGLTPRRRPSPRAVSAMEARGIGAERTSRMANRMVLSAAVANPANSKRKS